MVVVVGAASGIGEACARALGSEGAVVAVCDRDVDGARRVAAAIPSGHAFELDLARLDRIEPTIAEIEARLGPIDHLASTAGIFRAISMLDAPPELWEELFRVNVFGVVATLRAVGTRMRDRGRGSIVVVASQSAKTVRLRQATYGASKAALTYATKALGLELAPSGVRVNVVQPGTTDTPLAQALWQAGKGSAESHVRGALENFRAPIPLGKVGQPGDVAGAVLFLLSDDAGHVTMSELLVDGGSSYIA